MNPDSTSADPAPAPPPDDRPSAVAGRGDPVPFVVTVYASSAGLAQVPASYAAIARTLGSEIAAAGWTLVYGGADVGLMGAVADAALGAGGRVEGVLLDTFAQVAHRRLDDLTIVGDMRTRKAGLAHRGDAFCVLPGGIGTLEEVSEIIVERALGFHVKPLVVIDPDGFWEPLRAQLARMVDAGMLEPRAPGVITWVGDAEEAIVAIRPAAMPDPARSRPLDPTRYGTESLPALPQRDRTIVAERWVEAPPEIIGLGDDLGRPPVAYKRRIGHWLLWRAGPPSGAHARYGAVDADDLSRIVTFRLYPDGSGDGVGADGQRHVRFRAWKESLR